MSKMNEIYIKMMEEHYNSLSEEESNHLKLIQEEYKYWEQNSDVSP